MDADFLLAYHHVHHHHVHHSHIRSTPKTHSNSNYNSTATNMVLLNSARHRTHTTITDSTKVNRDFSISHKQGEYVAFSIIGAILLFVAIASFYNYFKEED